MYTPFDELKISLRTFIVNIKGKIDREVIYETFPVTIIKSTKIMKNNKLPHLAEFPGSIISMTLCDSFRGIKNKPFKNATSFILCLKQNNIAVSIFDSKTDTTKTKIKLAGPKSLESVHEAMGYMRDYLIQVQSVLDHIQEDFERAFKVLKWMIATLPNPDGTLKQVPLIPENIDTKIARYFLSFYPEFSNWNEYEVVLRWIIGIERVIPSDFKDFNYNCITSTMTNYNYYLGFKINRPELVQQILLHTNFKAIYDNTKQSCVKLELPYQRDESFMDIRKKKEETKHSFQVHRSGKVTQSGPNPELMKPVYEYFRDFICKVKDLVMYEDDEVVTEETETTNEEVLQELEEDTLDSNNEN